MNAIRFRRRPEFFATLFLLIGLGLAPVRGEASSVDNARLRAAEITTAHPALSSPPALATVVQNWFWQGLGGSIAAITAMLFTRGMIHRSRRRTRIIGANT